MAVAGFREEPARLGCPAMVLWALDVDADDRGPAEPARPWVVVGVDSLGAEDGPREDCRRPDDCWGWLARRRFLLLVVSIEPSRAFLAARADMGVLAVGVAAEDPPPPPVESRLLGVD